MTATVDSRGGFYNPHNDRQQPHHLFNLVLDVVKNHSEATCAIVATS